MGIDAVIVAVVPKEQATPELLKRAAHDLSVEFKGRGIWHEPDDPEERALTIASGRIEKDRSGKKYWQFCEPPDGSCVGLEVSTTNRYYGTDYERGDLPTIVQICEWLEQRFPGCAIMYGGDSCDWVNSFGSEKRAELMEHFTKHGNWANRKGGR